MLTTCIPKRRRSRLIGWSVVVAIALLLIGDWHAIGQTQGGSITATVDYAASGNTLELLFELSPELPITTIRLEGMQAPDLAQVPWGKDARDCLAGLRNQIIRVETDDWTVDKHDRLWAYSWKGHELLNQTMLEQGCAYLTADRLAAGSHYQRLLYAQERARLLGLGIWHPDQPLRETPESFRQRSHSP